MVAHLNIPSIEKRNIPSSLSNKVVNDLLKNELGFKGLIFTDALNMKGVKLGKNIENIEWTSMKLNGQAYDQKT